MFRNFILGLLSFLLLSVNTGFAQNAEFEMAAIASAEKWLAKIDDGKYSESWDDAAAYFKTAAKQDQWVNSLQAGRKPLGKMLSRKVLNKKYMTSVPGAPDGKYVVIQFETSFENKKSAIETVTPLLDKDTKWKVSGYFIK